MSSSCKTKEVRLSASERAVLVALVQRREVTATGLAGVMGLSLATTRRALRRFESLGAAVCLSRTSIDGLSALLVWSASPAVLDLLAGSGALPMARALFAPCARDKVLTAMGLRPGLSIEDIAWATALSRTSVVQMLAALEKQGSALRVERRSLGGARLADGWTLTMDAAAKPLFEL